MTRVGRTPVDYIVIHATGKLTIGQDTYERAGSPLYLRPEWDGHAVVLWRADQPEKSKQGVVKITPNPARFSAKPLIAEAGLIEGRYQPIRVDHERIVFKSPPFWTPDYTWDPEALVDHSLPTSGAYSVEQAAGILGVAPQKLAKDIQEGIIKPQNLNPDGKRMLYILSDRDLDLYRRWRWETQRIGPDPDAAE